MIVGGAILLWVDQLDLKPREHEATRFPLLMYFWIGLAQCVAMIPGVSRSGASIVAAMLLGADKRAAAEFSFFLAIPTMVGAFAYDFYKSHGDMTMNNFGIVAIGFVVSFITAMIVVKTFLDLRHASRLCAVRLVARDRRHARAHRAGDGKVVGCPDAVSSPGLTGRSSTPRLLGSIIDASGILGRPVKPGDDD